MNVSTHEILQIRALRDNYIWTIVKKDSNRCVIVDPGEASVVLDFLRERKLILSAILITHHHWDHTGGVPILKQHFPEVAVYGPAKESVAGMTHFLKDGDAVDLPELALHFAVMDIPGHTLGHIAYFGHGLVFSGDTLFTAGCGKIFEGTTEQMYASLSALSELPDETLVYCGHEYTKQNLAFAHAVEPNNSDIELRRKYVNDLLNNSKSTVPETIYIEKKTNPFLRIGAKSVIKAAEDYCKHPMNNPVETLHTLREWKNREY